MTITPSKRSQKWQPKPNQDLIRGDAIAPNAAVAGNYNSEMRSLIRKMSAGYLSEIRALFKEPDVKEFFAQDDTPSAQARILTNYLSKKFLDLFARRAKPIAEKFASQSDKANKAAVQSSLQKMAGQFVIPREAMNNRLDENLSAIVTENVGLIKSISQQYLSQVQGSVMRSISNGTGLAQLVKEMQTQKEISSRRAELISLDQTRKTSEVLSRNRFQARGIEEYTWRHISGSKEPRHLHLEYDGKVFRYDTPVLVQAATRTQPAMYGFPGTAIFCRCMAVPVIRIKE